MEVDAGGGTKVSSSDLLDYMRVQAVRNSDGEKVVAVIFQRESSKAERSPLFPS